MRLKKGLPMVIAKSRWVWVVLIVGLASALSLTRESKDLGSSLLRSLSLWLREGVSMRQEAGNGNAETHRLPAPQTGIVGMESGGEAEQDIAKPIFIQQSAVALAVEDREPKHIRRRVSIGQGRVYFWLHVVNGRGREITVRWIGDGEPLSESHLSIGSDDFRTWAYKTLTTSMIGPVEVQILDDTGKLLKVDSFLVEAKEAAPTSGTSKPESASSRHDPWHFRLEPLEPGRR